MPHHKIYVGGVEYPWSYLKYKRSFSIPAQEFTVHIPSLESFTPGDTIEIKRDGTTVAKGALAMGAWRTDQGVKTVLTSFDYRRKFQLLPGVFTDPDVEAATHLLNQLVNTDLTQGTFNTYGAITVDYGTTEQARFDRRRIAEEIMFITGWEFYTNPAGVCNFKSQCGTDRSSTIRFSREEGTLRGWPEDYVQTGLLKVEKVTVIGKGVGSHQAYGSAQTGGYSAGDPETTVNRKTLVNNTLCGTAATALLADMQHVIKYGVAQVINVNEGLAFDVFDTINIRDERLGIDENLRVAGITVEARADEGETTLVEICNIIHLQTSGELLIGDVRGRVEDDFSRTRQIANLDEVDDGSTYKKTTEDEKSGAGYAYLGLDTGGEAIYTRAGTSFPESPGLNEIFFRSDEELYYRYDGASWLLIGVKAVYTEPSRTLCSALNDYTYVYQNTSKRPLLCLVTVQIMWATVTEMARAVAYIGTDDTPGNVVAYGGYYSYAGAGTSMGHFLLTFVVPAGYYYRVCKSLGGANTVDKNEWHEVEL